MSLTTFCHIIFIINPRGTTFQQPFLLSSTPDTCTFISHFFIELFFLHVCLPSLFKLQLESSHEFVLLYIFICGRAQSSPCATCSCTLFHVNRHVWKKFEQCFMSLNGVFVCMYALFEFCPWANFQYDSCVFFYTWDHRCVLITQYLTAWLRVYHFFIYMIENLVLLTFHNIAAF